MIPARISYVRKSEVPVLSRPVVQITIFHKKNDGGGGGGVLKNA